MKVRIRLAQRGDIAALSDVFRRSALSNEGDRIDLLENPEAIVFPEESVYEQRTRVALVDDRVVGFATTTLTAETIELDDLFVDPEWMRRGVGIALVQDVMATARQRGVPRVEVAANTHSLAFYEKAGFVPHGVAKTQFGGGPRMHLDVATTATTRHPPLRGDGPKSN